MWPSRRRPSPPYHGAPQSPRPQPSPRGRGSIRLPLARARARGLGGEGRTRLLAVLASAAVLLTACYRQQMGNAPRYDPLEPSALFADGQSARQPVTDTVARGQLRQDALLDTGMENGPAVRPPAVPGQPRGARSRTGSLRHLLRALPRPAPATAMAWSCSAGSSRRRRFTLTRYVPCRSATSSTSRQTASARCHRTPPRYRSEIGGTSRRTSRAAIEPAR